MDPILTQVIDSDDSYTKNIQTIIKTIIIKICIASLQLN